MGMKRPIYDTDNSSNSKHSQEYAIPLSSFEDVPCTFTLTIDMSVDEITASAPLAGRFQIIQNLGKSKQDGSKTKYNEIRQWH
jgi:hypothetical protein